MMSSRTVISILRVGLCGPKKWLMGMLSSAQQTGGKRSKRKEWSASLTTILRTKTFLPRISLCQAHTRNCSEPTVGRGQGWWDFALSHVLGLYSTQQLYIGNRWIFPTMITLKTYTAQSPFPVPFCSLVIFRLKKNPENPKPYFDNHDFQY